MFFPGHVRQTERAHPVTGKKWQVGVLEWVQEHHRPGRSVSRQVCALVKPLETTGTFNPARNWMITLIEPASPQATKDESKIAIARQAIDENFNSVPSLSMVGSGAIIMSHALGYYYFKRERAS